MRSSMTRRRGIRTLGGGDSLPSISNLLIAFYDVTDVSTLFQDTARTSPITADGQMIKGVADKSGQGNHLSEATNGPTYKVPLLNGKPGARFDGVNDTLLCASWTGGSISMPYTLFMVGAYQGTFEDNSPMTDGGDGITRAHMVMSSSVDKWGVFYGASIPVGGTWDTAKHVFCSTALTPNPEFRVDGGANVVGAANAGTSALQGIQLAANSAAGGSTFARFDLMYVLVYSGNLSNADKNLIGQWLAGQAGTIWTPAS